MIYVVSIRKYFDGNRSYILFETGTESFFKGDKEFLRDLIVRYRMNLRNTNLIDYEETDTLWYNKINCTDADGISTESEYVLMCTINNNTFKLISKDKEVIYVDREKLTKYTEANKIANCQIKNDKYKSIGTYTVNRDMQFENLIAEKYKAYEAKSTLLGRKMSFEYIIEGRQVKLKEYTGTTKDVIVPKFITSIMDRAFIYSKIETVILEEGLKSIGNCAFEGCNLSEVVIPKTVQFLGKGAFFRNKKLIADSGGYWEDKVKVLSKKTTMLDKWNYTFNTKKC